MGDGITLRAHVENTTSNGIPMTLGPRRHPPAASCSRPGSSRMLRDKGQIRLLRDTAARGHPVLARAPPRRPRRNIDLNLLAAVPGTYEAPASSAYLYYTAEDKAWTQPVAITVDK